MPDALDDVIWELEDPDEVLRRPAIAALPADRLAAAFRQAECVRLERAVAHRARALTTRDARRFVSECVAQVLPQWSARYPDDDRPQRALQVARRLCAEGAETISDEHRTAVERAAVAAGDAAYEDCFPAEGPLRCPPGVSFSAIAHAAAYACREPLRPETVARYVALADDAMRRPRLEWQLAWLEAFAGEVTTTEPSKPPR